jgi:uncharacterized protein HemX
MASSSKKGSGGKSVAAGLALGAVAAAAAAGLYLYNQSPKARKQMRAWAIKAKAEMIERLEKMQDVSEETYNAAADAITARYAKVKTIGEMDAQTLNAELKKHYRAIKRELASTGGTGAGKKVSAKKSGAKK